MIEIYVVEYHLHDYECEAIYPVKAFRDERKAEEFIKECQAECLRIDIEVENYWFKHQKEHDELGKLIREKIKKRQYSNDLQEVKRNVEIMTGKRNIINSHKHHPNYPGSVKDDFSYEITSLELVE